MRLVRSRGIAGKSNASNAGRSIARRKTLRGDHRVHGNSDALVRKAFEQIAHSPTFARKLESANFTDA